MKAPSSSRRPPGPAPLPLLGNSLAFARDPLGFLSGVARDYGDIAFLRLGGYDVYFISHPALVREMLVLQRSKFEIAMMRTRLEIALGKGLLTSRGEDHARQRRVMQPVFRKSRIDSYAAPMAELTERQCGHWTPGAELDINAETGRLAMLIAGRTFFSLDVEGEVERVSHSLEKIMQFYEGLMSPFMRLRYALPLPSTMGFRRARDELDRSIYRIIEDRRRRPSEGDDLLSLLIRARDEHTNVGMTAHELRDELLTLLIAGHETTANALAWSLYLLAGHPDVQQRIHEEVSAAFGSKARPDAAAVSRLTSVRQVLLEGMRLYPPGWIIGRVALQDVELGGYTVPRNANVLTSQWVVQRDARTFEQPLEFRPERWTEAFMKGLSLGAYFPFSAGERHCIGENFAWLEASLVLAMMLHRWRFELVPGQDIHPKPSITLRSNTGIRLRPYRW